MASLKDDGHLERVKRVSSRIFDPQKEEPVTKRVVKVNQYHVIVLPFHECVASSSRKRESCVLMMFTCP